MLNQPKSKYLSLLVATMGIFSVATLAGCQQAVPASQRFSSVQGVNLEAFMPADTFLFGKVGTSDQSQLDAFKILNGYFPGDPAGEILKQFNAGFKDGAKLEQFGLDYETDILPILNNKSQFYVAIAPNAKDAKMANFYLAMTVADTAKFDGILDKQVQQKYLKKEDYSGQPIYSEVTTSATPAYMARYMDAVLMTNSEDSLKAGLDNVKANNDAFANNVNFKKAMNDYKPNLALVYANVPELVNVMGAAEGKSSEDIAKALAGSDIATQIQSEMLMMTAEKEGLRVAAKVFGKDGVDLTQNNMAGSMPAYMMKKIPANNPIVYVEGGAIKKSYEAMLKSLGSDPDFSKSMQDMKDYLASQQLDFDKDILSILDKGVAFVFDDTGTPIPSIGLYIDTSSNPDGAMKVADKLNKGFDFALADAESQSPDIKMVVSKEEVTPGKLWKIKLNLDLVLTQVPSALSQKLSGQKVEFYYGLLDDGVMVLALKPDLEKVYGKEQTVEKSGEFAAALKNVSGEYRGLVYMSPAQVIGLTDRLLKLAQDSTGQAGIPEYDAVRGDITPIKSLIFSGGTVLKDQINADFFLHIGQ